MNQYTITYTPSIINFRPATVLDEIFQNVNTIVGTAKYSVPLFRNFGVNADFIDQPMNKLHPLLVAKIIEAVEEFEPRVIVEEVKMNADINGKAYPTIKFTLRDGVIV